jgi:plastocyanin
MTGLFVRGIVRIGAVALFSLAAGPAFAQGAPRVAEQALTFAPKELHVSPGTTVVWSNASAAVHTVTADDGSFDSGDQSPGDMFEWTFDSPGTYQYFCQQHGAPDLTDMAGVIVVDG